MDSWIKVTASLPSQLATAAECIFEAAGALAIEMVDAADQPLFEPPPGTTPLWDLTNVSGLFNGDYDPGELIDSLARDLSLDKQALRVETIADRNWLDSWRDHFQSGPIGEQLWIGCEGETIPEGKSGILLNPGLAFGTGSHPTTRLCLEWLDEQATADKVSGKQVLDYGCGSGILALGAAALGAGKIIAVDYDPQALLATDSNAVENGHAAAIHACLPGDEPDTEFDLLLANILANPLIELAETLSQRLKPGGGMVLSGVLEAQAAGVCAAWQPWFSPLVVRQSGDWVSISGIRLKN